MSDIDWQPMTTAPRDGTWIFSINNRGNCAVIIWSDSANNGSGSFRPGWIHPFTTGELSSFWNGSCGSYPVAWAAAPHGAEAGIIVDRFKESGREAYYAEQESAKVTLAKAS